MSANAASYQRHQTQPGRFQQLQVQGPRASLNMPANASPADLLDLELDRKARRSYLTDWSVSHFAGKFVTGRCHSHTHTLLYLMLPES